MIKIPSFEEARDKVESYELFKEELAKADSRIAVVPKPTPLEYFIYEEEPVSLSSKDIFYQNLEGMLWYVIDEETKGLREVILSGFEEQEEESDRQLFKDLLILVFLIGINSILYYPLVL